MEHLSQEQLDALVMGTASRDDEAVRRHLATCVTCARRLAREAQLESDLYAAAATAPIDIAMTRAHPAPLWSWRVAVPVAAGLAVVAFGTWFLLARVNRQDSAPPPAAVEVPSANVPGLAAPRNPGRNAQELSPADVCRCVTVERTQGPPSNPGAGPLCTSG